MGVIQRFERKLQTTVGDAFARVFGGGVVPREVEAALQQEAADRVRELPGGHLLAPNAYVITINSSDHEKLASDTELTTTAFARHLDGYLREMGWQTYGDVSVRFEASPSLHSGQFRTRGTVDPDAGRPVPAVTPNSNTGARSMSQNPGHESERDGEDHYRGAREPYPAAAPGASAGAPGRGPAARPGDNRNGYRNGNTYGVTPRAPYGPPAGGGRPGDPRPADGRGYEQAGYEQAGYDQAGYDQGAAYEDQAGYDQAGYDGRAGYGRPRPYEQPADYPADPRYQPGYEDGGYPQGGYEQPRGYQQPRAYEPGGYEPGGYPQDRGYPARAYEQPRAYDAPAAYDDRPGYDDRQGYDAPAAYSAPAAYEPGAPAAYDAPAPAGYRGPGYGKDDYDYSEPGYDAARGLTATLQLEDGSGRHFQLREGSNVIGRGQDAQFRLPDTGVSRRHIEIRWDGRVAMLSDLGSTNGTTVNGAPVQDWQLADGDIVRAGHSEILVRIV